MSTEPRWVKHYPKGVPPKLDQPYFNHIPEMVRTTAAKFHNKIAYTMCLPNGASASLSFNEIDRYADAFAVYLREELKLQPGDRVALQSPNCLDYPIVAFGVFKAGCVVVNTNPLYTPAEMIHQFSDSGATVLVIASLFGDKLAEVLPRTAIKHVLTIGMTDFYSFPFRMLAKILRPPPKCAVSTTPMVAALKRGEALRAERSIDPASYSADLSLDSLAVLQYTGGTTGVSKGAMLTHGNLAWHTSTTDTFCRIKMDGSNEIILTALPMYHIFAFATNLLNFFYNGSQNILIPSPRPLTNLKKAFEKYHITWMTGVNTLFAGLLKEPWFRANPPTQIKVAIAGGAALHQAVAHGWKDLIGVLPFEGYGLTETSPTITYTPMEGINKIGSIGIPIPNWEIKLVKDDGTEAAVGEPGELACRGPQNLTGYWGRKEETEQAIKDGWFYTGDIATMDEDGYFKIVDRKKDMILMSGFNVYPNEVEECLTKLAGVAEAAVIGIPHEKTGEAVKAFVVRNNDSLTEAEVIQHCRKLLTGYKVPKLIEFRTDLPKTTVGKILRRELREQELKKT